MHIYARKCSATIGIHLLYICSFTYMFLKSFFVILVSLLLSVMISFHDCVPAMLAFLVQLHHHFYRTTIHNCCVPGGISFGRMTVSLPISIFICLSNHAVATVFGLGSNHASSRTGLSALCEHRCLLRTSYARTLWLFNVF